MKPLNVDPNWLKDFALQDLMARFEDGGFQIFAVGGCVRDAVLGWWSNDIDLSTDARPEDIVRIADENGHKAVPTGIEHGTVTVVVHHHGYEITTFRKDVETDGRRAVVAFSDNMYDDAVRRDFTMNALYMRRDGTVVDPIGGFGDLQARRVRFIGDPIERINEDYLRILRFFRFYASHGRPTEGIDPDGLAACALLAQGLSKVSRERIGAEMTKLLRTIDPGPAVAAMEHAGVLSQILPGASARVLPRLIHLENEYPIEGRMLPPHDTVARLASLGGEGVADRLRLSKHDARSHALFSQEMAGVTPPEELGYRHDYWTAIHILMLRWALMEQPFDEAALERVALGGNAKFPLRAADLMPDFSGPALGARLNELEQRWIASGFQLSREQLLS